MLCNVYGPALKEADFLRKDKWQVSGEMNVQCYAELFAPLEIVHVKNYTASYRKPIEAREKNR